MSKKSSRRSASSRFALVAGQEYKVLSIHPEWAWAIIFGGKDIENRSWVTDYRGTLLIHASSKRNSRDRVERARTVIRERSGLSSAELPAEFPASSILGAVELVDCLEFADSPWAIDDQIHWVLHTPRPLAHPVTNIMGKLQIWRWAPSAEQARESEGGAGATGRGVTARAKLSTQADVKQELVPRGSRRIDDISSDEILACLRSCATSRPGNEVDVLRAASRQLGFARMGARVEQVLKAHVKRAVRRGMLQREPMGLRTGTRG